MQNGGQARRRALEAGRRGANITRGSPSWIGGLQQPRNETPNRYPLSPSSLSKSSEAELMQYLSPVGAGPSGNTWPR